MICVPMKGQPLHIPAKNFLIIQMLTFYLLGFLDIPHLRSSVFRVPFLDTHALFYAAILRLSSVHVSIRWLFGEII
jgi:uncharacterized MAPEG superfamily protein